MSSYSDWARGIANRNYHLFQSLLNHQDVKRIVVVDFLPFTLKRTTRNYLENIIKGQKGKIIYRDLTARCTQVNEKLFVFSTIDSFFSSQRVIKKLKLVLSKIPQLPNCPDIPACAKATAGRQVPRIIWSCFPMFVDYFAELNGDLRIFDAVDNWLEHPSFVKYRQQLKENYQIIADNCDLIFTVSESLIDFFRDFGRAKNIFWLPNGVDAEHFRRPSTKAPKDIKKIPRPIVGYIGIIQNRVDINLLEYFAQKNPDKSLVLIGPIWPNFLRRIRRPAIEIRRLKKYKNVHLLGRKSYQISPNYLNQFDVAIVPHILNDFTKSMNPLKIYEYLACGKPVVTTPIAGVEKFSHLIYIAQDYRDFNEKIQKALGENSPQLIDLRLQAARENSWQLKTEQMLEIIKSYQKSL